VLQQVSKPKEIRLALAHGPLPSDLVVTSRAANRGAIAVPEARGRSRAGCNSRNTYHLGRMQKEVLVAEMA
jgi:hypothetical protein